MLHFKKEEIFPKMFYWLDKNRNEVDVILTIRKTLIPIEIKYSNNISKKELKGILCFMKTYEIKKGLVITKDILKQQNIDGNVIYFIPIWLFLLNIYTWGT